MRQWFTKGKSGVAILFWNKSRNRFWDREHYIMIRKLFISKDPDPRVPSHVASKCMKQNLTELQEKLATSSLLSLK